MPPEDKDIRYRFGEPIEFEYSFVSMDRLDVREEFQKFNSMKNNTDNYEKLRQQFLKLLGQHQMIWHPTNDTIDMFVDVSRIYGRNKTEYLAFMRIMPRGFRGERTIPAGKEMVFHLLVGKAAFTYRKRTKLLARGHYINLASRSTYSIRSICPDQPTYLVFRVIDKKTPLALPPAPKSTALQPY